MKKRFTRGGKGFTLIELVIVIAVLGILGGLAISRYQSFAEESRGATHPGQQRTGRQPGNPESHAGGVEDSQPGIEADADAIDPGRQTGIGRRLGGRRGA